MPPILSLIHEANTQTPMSHVRRSLTCLCLLLCGLIACAQYRNAVMKGGHTLKLHLPFNPNEIGLGASYQYYVEERLGLQFNVDMLYPVRLALFLRDNARLSGLGIRVAPELRYYATKVNRGNKARLLIGGGPMFKAIRVNERYWGARAGGEESSNASKPLLGTYKNKSFGLMGRIGAEVYPGDSGRWLIEGSLGLGVTYNQVKKYGDQIPFRDGFSFLEDISVSNRNSGILPYIDIRAAIGYRFFSRRP